MTATNFVRARPWLSLLLLALSLACLSLVPWSTGAGTRAAVVAKLMPPGKGAATKAAATTQTTTTTTQREFARPVAGAPVNENLVVYTYFETDEAKVNLQFFLDHAVHDHLDFLFIVNGEQFSIEIPERSNFKVIHRPNKCYDLGSVGETLWANNAELKNRYKKFILINASVRGPFMPGWAQNYGLCWSEIYLKYLTDTTKLAGLTANCDARFAQHLQSMVLVTDQLGLDLIKPALRCANDFWDAVINGEVRLTGLVRNAGFDVTPIMSEARSKDFALPEDYWRQCKHGDYYYPHAYEGMDVHPYDTLFVKLHRTQVTSKDPALPFSDDGMHAVRKLTEWADASNYSSYDYC